MIPGFTSLDWSGVQAGSREANAGYLPGLDWALIGAVPLTVRGGPRFVWVNGGPAWGNAKLGEASSPMGDEAAAVVAALIAAGCFE